MIANMKMSARRLASKCSKWCNPFYYLPHLTYLSNCPEVLPQKSHRTLNQTPILTQRKNPKGKAKTPKVTMAAKTSMQSEKSSRNNILFKCRASLNA